MSRMGLLDRLPTMLPSNDADPGPVVRTADSLKSSDSPVTSRRAVRGKREWYDLQLRLARTSRTENEDETKPISRLGGAA